jgi:cytochrome c
MDSAAGLPIPRDIPLPLPADPVLLQALLVMLFLVHILFVCLMVGGSLIGIVAEIVGRRRPDFDNLAREVGKTITVNKSLAVVLGVGPLLAINVFYTVYFYSANALTGAAWISIVPLVTAAFLAAYAHKYSWDKLERAKGLHIAIGAFSSLLFLLIPFIFLSNINLMLFPAQWPRVHGFFSALLLPNVIPRYLHFLLASVAIAALFLAAYFGRPGFPVEEKFTTLDRPTLRRIFYSTALAASLGQLLVGPLVLLSLPRQGMSWYLLLVVAIGVTFGISTMVMLWREIVAPCRTPNRRFMAIFSLITLTAFTMGYGRHVYRENAIDEHRRLMAEKTREYGWAVVAAQWRAAQGIEQVQIPLGEKIFSTTCAACHAVDRVLVGPPLTEIAQLYSTDAEGIVRWANNPGKKRQGFPQMPAFRMGDDKLRAVADYMIQLGTGGTPAAAPEQGTAPVPARGTQQG